MMRGLQIGRLPSPSPEVTHGRLAVKTRLEFAIDIALIGREPKPVGKEVKDTPAHIYAGASLLVAGV